MSELILKNLPEDNAAERRDEWRNCQKKEPEVCMLIHLIMKQRPKQIWRFSYQRKYKC